MKYFNKFSIAALGLLTLASCSDMDEQLPEGNTVTESQLEEITAAVPERVAADLQGLYSYTGQAFAVFGSASGRHDDFGYPAICLSFDLNSADMVCDNVGYNWFSVSSEYSDRTPNYANPYMRYTFFYNQIRSANDLMLSIDPETEDATLRSYLGQAYAMRAFDYLNLAPYFQFSYKGHEDDPCVPLVTNETPDFSNNPRATMREVYGLIVDDLTKAIDLLDGYTRTSKANIDQKVAYGLRARAYLAMSMWAEAAADAEKAMEGYTPASIEEVAVPTFVRIDEPNWLWGIILEEDKVAAMINSAGQLGSFSGNSYTAAVSVYKRINSLLFDKIPDTDVRKGWWVDADLHSANLENIDWDGATGDDISYLEIEDVKTEFQPYTNVKFGMKNGIGSVTNNNDWPLMRVEELILIQAEGLAKSGNEAQAKQVLNDFVRTYRDPAYDCSSLSGVDLHNEIWKQRRIELWGEGFAMADVMRLGKPVVRIHGSNKANWPDAFAFNIASNDPWLLMRFPDSETETNQGVTTKDNAAGSQPKAGQNADLLDGVTN